MDLGLKNKKALVTGASRGLGFATALELSGEKKPGFPAPVPTLQESHLPGRGRAFAPFVRSQ